MANINRQTDYFSREEAVRAARAREVVRAGRHSRVVRVLRRFLPLSVVLMIFAAFLPNFIYLRDDTPLVDVSNITYEAGEVAMENPRVQGFSASGQRYDILSRSAYQNILNPQSIRFEGVDGVIAASNEGATAIRAERGIFQGELDKVTLEGNVVIVRPDGERFQAEKMDVSLSTSEVMAIGGVEMATENGQMQATTMHVEEGGDKVAFEGPVKVIMHYRAEDHQKSKRDEAQ